MKCNKPTVVITSNLFKPSIGGVENSLHHLALAYIDLGFQPIIVVSDLSISDDVLPEYELSEGVQIYRYSMTKRYKLLGVSLPKPLSGILNAIALYKQINNKYHPQLLIARYHFNQLFAKFSGIKNTLYLVPGVVKYQNSPKHISKNSFKSRLQWRYHMFLQYWAFRLSDRIAVFSHNMIHQVNNISAQKISPLLTKPGVDMERFYPIPFAEKLMLREQLIYPCKGKIFLCVGRSVKAKGIDIALRAFAQLKGTEHQLWIVGDGPLIDEYKDLARELQITFQVVFFGVQSAPEQFYRAADFFIMSSIYEPLGQTILEALASGLPILAFQPSSEIETATLELVNDEQAIFTKHAEPTSLGKLMKSVSCWSDEKYTKKSLSCRKHAIDNFSWKSLACTLLGEFEYEK